MSEPTFNEIDPPYFSGPGHLWYPDYWNPDAEMPEWRAWALDGGPSSWPSMYGELEIDRAVARSVAQALQTDLENYADLRARTEAEESGSIFSTPLYTTHHPGVDVSGTANIFDVKTSENGSLIDFQIFLEQALDYFYTSYESVIAGIFVSIEAYDLAEAAAERPYTGIGRGHFTMDASWMRTDIQEDDVLMEMQLDKSYGDEGAPYMPLGYNEFNIRMTNTHGAKSAEFGNSLLSVAGLLTETVSTLTTQGQKLAGAWGGEAAENAADTLLKFRTAIVHLAAATGTVGEGTRWFGEDVYPTFVNLQNEVMRDPFGAGVHPVWDHEVGGNNCDCSVFFANPLAWTGVDTATCIREEHVYHYEHSGATVTHPRDAIPSVSPEDLYSGELGRWVNETERQAISDRKLDPSAIYSTATARMIMNKLNDQFKALHNFLPSFAHIPLPRLSTRSADD